LKKVVIIGGGITGLSAAFWASKRGHDVLLLEASEHLGGNIRAHNDASFPFEQGPNTILDNRPLTQEFLTELELDADVVEAADVAQERMVYLNGALRKVAPSPLKLLKTLGLFGFLRMAIEPFIPRGRPEKETVAEFFDRRIGSTARKRLVDAFIGGIYAGDSTALSMQACFPRVLGAIQNHGSLFKALRALKTNKRARTISFNGGMVRWPSTVAEKLPQGTVKTGVKATSIVKTEAGYEVEVNDGTSTTQVMCKSVVLCVPAPQAAALLENVWSDHGIRALKEIPYSSVVTMGVSWPAVPSLRAKVGAFGFLAPRGQGLRILGSVFSSSIFPKSFPDQTTAVSVFIGGSTDPEACSSSDETLFEVVKTELTKVFGASLPLKLHSIRRWLEGIPQLTMGHHERIEQIRKSEKETPGVLLAGNYLEGVSLHDAIASGKRAVDALDAPRQQP